MVNKLEESCNILKDKNIRKLSSKMYSKIIKVLENSYDIIEFEEDDDILDAYNEIILLEDKIDTIYDSINKYLISKDDDSINMEKILVALRKSEKIANRAVSIASVIRYPYNNK